MTAVMPEPDDDRIEQDPEPDLHPAQDSGFPSPAEDPAAVLDHGLPDDDGQPEVPPDDQDTP